MSDAAVRPESGSDQEFERSIERSPVVSAATLRRLLDGAQAPLLLDVRWSLNGTLRQDYLDARLPGARFVDLETDLTEPHQGAVDERGRHPLPEVGRLQLALRVAGVSADQPVVVYDGRDGLAASRAWWLLRWAGHPDVRVLDGGLRAWRAEGGAVESGEPAASAEGDFTVRQGQLPLAELSDVVERADRVGGTSATGRQRVLLDARAAERYRGEREPMDQRPGHIPGAINLPMAELTDDDGRLLPATELQQRFSAVLGAMTSPEHLGPPPIASCGSGITACHTVLAAHAAGYPMALFPGSYSGWCATGREVNTGDQP